jgi:hypothetical protein
VIAVAGCVGVSHGGASECGAVVCIGMLRTDAMVGWAGWVT